MSKELDVLNDIRGVEMAWRGYVVCNHAIVTPLKAWEAALQLDSSQLDSGLSKTQVRREERKKCNGSCLKNVLWKRRFSHPHFVGH